MPGPYELGQLVHLKMTFTTGGTVEDPTTIELGIKKANQSALTYNYGDPGIERLGKGLYRLSVTADVPGVWKWRARSTGAVQTAGRRQFIVNKADA